MSSTLLCFQLNFPILYPIFISRFAIIFSVYLHSELSLFSINLHQCVSRPWNGIPPFQPAPNCKIYNANCCYIELFSKKGARLKNIRAFCEEKLAEFRLLLIYWAMNFPRPSIVKKMFFVSSTAFNNAWKTQIK